MPKAYVPWIFNPMASRGWPARLSCFADIEKISVSCRSAGLDVGLFVFRRIL